MKSKIKKYLGEGERLFIVTHVYGLDSPRVSKTHDTYEFEDIKNEFDFSLKDLDIIDSLAVGATHTIDYFPNERYEVERVK